MTHWTTLRPLAHTHWKAIGGPPMAPIANYVLRNFGVHLPPVPMAEIVKALGVRLFAATNFGSLEGAIHFPGEGATMWVNEGHTETKKRFTMAHTLGHLLLHEERTFRELSYVGPFSEQQEEVEASTFATHLLIMPLWILEPYLVAKRRTDEEAAKAFGVSVIFKTLRQRQILGLYSSVP